MVTNRSSKFDLVLVKKRVVQKRQDYISYDFSPRKNDTLKTFFDLSQEFDSLHDLYRICVVVPLESFGVDSCLYLLSESYDGLKKVCDSKDGICMPPEACPDQINLTDKACEIGQSYIVPIFSKPLHLHSSQESQAVGVIGIFEIFPVDKLTKSDKFFFTKYTNRIGYNLRKRLLAQQNIKHLKFINNLVSDIEHNVIVPNMFYKYLFNRFKKKISELTSLTTTLESFEKSDKNDPDMCKMVINKITDIKEGLVSSFDEIDKHHSNQSLFLESLFRRDHFEEGRLVLHPRRCKLEAEIIIPQLSHYERRMVARNIQIAAPVDMKDEDVEINVDFGLLSQVYANLFSNAVKYTEEICTTHGHCRKAMAYGRKIIYNHFGPGRAGIKLNVFTTGKHLSAFDARSIFKDGFVGRNSFKSESSGHGLAFVRYVVELHGGEVGYDGTEEGNNFYFILPLLSRI